MKNKYKYAIIAFLLSIPVVTDAKVYNTDWCDIMYTSLWFQNVPSTIQKECGNRFIYNTNIQKAYFRNH